MTSYIMVSDLNKGIAESIGRKRGKYGELIKGWIHWSTKRSGINGTTDKYIRNMLTQILREIHITQSKATSVINSVYKKITTKDYKKLHSFFWLFSLDLKSSRKITQTIILNWINANHNYNPKNSPGAPFAPVSPFSPFIVENIFIIFS